MPANVDGMVREGISAYRAGRKDEARAFLLKAVELDEHNEQAWLWLSAVVESVDEQRICLENVLAINPNNERALQGLQILSQKSGPPAPSKADDVLASVSFTPAPPPPPAPPPAPAPSSLRPAASPFSAAGEADEVPDIQWDEAPTATSSASSTRRVNEPSSGEYDDWVNSLNLGGGNTLLEDLGADFEAPSVMDEMAKFISTPSAFDDDEDEDLFGGLDVGTPVGDPFSGPFSAAETSVPPASAPRAAAPRTPPARAATPPKVDTLLDAVEEEEADEFISDFDDYDRATLDAPEPSELFRYIPAEITATRLPGTRERYPALVVLGLLAALALNFGAAALLVMRLTGG